MDILFLDPFLLLSLSLKEVKVIVPLSNPKVPQNELEGILEVCWNWSENFDSAWECSFTMGFVIKSSVKRIFSAILPFSFLLVWEKECVTSWFPPPLPLPTPLGQC
jgi:hypothetical protein